MIENENRRMFAGKQNHVSGAGFSIVPVGPGPRSPEVRSRGQLDDMHELHAVDGENRSKRATDRRFNTKRTFSVALCFKYYLLVVSFS